MSGNNFAEDELLPISALQHLVFCKRQWALIHLEQQWQENVLTVGGRQMHDRVHDSDASECRGNIRIARGLRLHSFRLGLVGQADVVEFSEDENGISQPYIIEYKHGKPKIDFCDEVQLCAQALCLEEMLNVTIPESDFFYGKHRRRHHVLFTEELRQKTEKYAEELHILTERGETPSAEYSSRCKNCSLFDICLPQTAGHQKSARRYIQQIFRQHTENQEDEGGNSL